MLGIRTYLKTCQAVSVVSRSDLNTQQFQTSFDFNSSRAEEYAAHETESMCRGERQMHRTQCLSKTYYFWYFINIPQIVPSGPLPWSKRTKETLNHIPPLWV